MATHMRTLCEDLDQLSSFPAEQWRDEAIAAVSIMRVRLRPGARYWRGGSTRARKAQLKDFC